MRGRKDKKKITKVMHFSFQSPLVSSLQTPASLIVMCLQTRAALVEEMRDGTKLQSLPLLFPALGLKKEIPEFLQVHRSRNPLMSGKVPCLPWSDRRVNVTLNVSYYVHSFHFSNFWR